MTGDSILTGFAPDGAVGVHPASLACLASIMTVLPQELINVRVADKTPSRKRRRSATPSPPLRPNSPVRAVGALASFGYRAARPGDGRGADRRRGARDCRAHRRRGGRRGSLARTNAPTPNRDPAATRVQHNHPIVTDVTGVTKRTKRSGAYPCGFGWRGCLGLGVGAVATIGCCRTRREAGAGPLSGAGLRSFSRRTRPTTVRARPGREEGASVSADQRKAAKPKQRKPGQRNQARPAATGCRRGAH